MKQYLIGFKNASNRMMYLAEWEGDPPRTYLIGCARFFNDKSDAYHEINKLKKSYNHRDINYQIIQINDT